MKQLTVKVANTARQGYKPCLKEMLSQCELNYALIQQLYPHAVNQQAVDGDEVSFINQAIELELTIVEVFKYTSTLELRLKVPSEAIKNRVKLVVRLYHDARMMEVVEGSGPGALKPVQHRNNRERKVADEKRQINRFVGECLSACL